MLYNTLHVRIETREFFRNFSTAITGNVSCIATHSRRTVLLYRRNLAGDHRVRPQFALLASIGVALLLLVVAVAERYLKARIHRVQC
jgi:hypothetical protein